MTTTTNTDALINYLVAQASTGAKNWFGFQQQRVTGIHLAYQIAERHADKMTPEEVTEYVLRLNNSIYSKLIKGD